MSEGQFVASSPDEKAILEFCLSKRFVFNGCLEDGKLLVTVAGGERKVYEKLAELSFDSFRKCMTVIVRDEEVGASDIVLNNYQYYMYY